MIRKVLIPRKYQANDGYVFALKDKSAVYGSVIFIGENDTISNYLQVSTQEADQIKALIVDNYNI